jgi:hypothetical protein
MLLLGKIIKCDKKERERWREKANLPTKFYE